MFWSDIRTNKICIFRVVKERLHRMAPQSKYKLNLTRKSKRFVKKVDLTLTEKHLGNIHEGLEGDEKVSHVEASKEVGFKLWHMLEDFINLEPLVPIRHSPLPLPS